MARLPCSLVSTSCGDAALHSRTLPSPLALASVSPSGENVTDRTRLVWRQRDWTSWPVATSHSLDVPSPLPLARVLPSGENATRFTPVLSPRRARIQPAAATPQSLTLRSQ